MFHEDHPSGLNPLQRLESSTALIWYLLLAVLPVSSALLRLFGGSDIPFLGPMVFHLVVMLTAMAGSFTESHNEHLNLDLGLDSSGKKLLRLAVYSRNILGTFLLMLFLAGSLEMLLVAFRNEKIFMIPLQFFVAFIPLGFSGILLHWMRRVVKLEGWLPHVLAVIAGLWFALPGLLNMLYLLPLANLEWAFVLENFWYAWVPVIIPFVVVLVILHIPAGLPLYLVLGGVGALLFLRGGTGPGIIIYEGYSVLDNSAISAIALFTMTGFLLSETRASQRFVELFLALFAWIPGGMVIASVLVSSVFTTFTGASGVTILALGGLLFGVLHGSGRYTEEFSTGLLTSSGSIGLLFPPSLAIILYGSVAGLNIRDVFLAGLVPGILLVAGVSIFGIFIARHTAQEDVRFSLPRALTALREAGWELGIPVLTLVLYFSGLASLLETAAISLLYTLCIELFVKRELNLAQLLEVARKSLRVVGGVLIILMLAKGLSSYIVDVRLPQSLAAMLQDQVSSKIVFLLLLNLALLVTGTLMDIYSAIFVVVPLILPLGEAFGVHPLHLAIIFLVNLELGFMTPPVGLNLFLSSYRFGKPLTTVYSSVMPFLAQRVVIVLLVTFIPQLSLVFAGG